MVPDIQREERESERSPRHVEFISLPAITATSDRTTSSDCERACPLSISSRHKSHGRQVERCRVVFSVNIDEIDGGRNARSAGERARTAACMHRLAEIEAETSGDIDQGVSVSLFLSVSPSVSL